MITEAIISAIGGGILRAVPEVLSFFDKKNERAHELAMMDKQTELKKLEAQSAMAMAMEEHEATVDAGLVNAFIEAQKAQAVQTGIKFVDALNALVRPTIAYAVFGLYAFYRVATLVVAIQSSPASWMQIAATCWTAEDMAMLNMILGFFFVGRAFLKK